MLVLGVVRWRTRHDKNKLISAFSSIVIRFESAVNIKCPCQLKLIYLDLQGSEHALVLSLELFLVQSLRTHEVLDEQLPAFLTADWDPLEPALPFRNITAIIYDESHLAGYERLQGAFLILGVGIVVFVQQNFVGVLLT